MDNSNIENSSEETEVKTKTKSKSSKKSALDFKKYTQQIWLAGLGAFSRAEEEGNKLFDSLVKVGEELESKTVDFADFLLQRTSCLPVPGRSLHGSLPGWRADEIGRAHV